MTRGERSLRTGLAADARRGVLVASAAIGAAAIAELIATLYTSWQYTDDAVGPGVLARLIALDVTLLAIVWLVVAPLCALGALAPRLAIRLVRGPDAARAYPGPGATPVSPRLVAWIWALAATGVVYVWWSSRATLAAFEAYKEHQLAAMLVAVQQLVAIGLLGAVAYGLARAIAAAGAALDRALPPAIRPANPLARAVPAALLTGAGLVAVLLVAGAKYPPLRPLVPWRWMIDGGAALIGGAIALGLLRRPRRAPRPFRSRRMAAAGAAAAAALILPATLIAWGGHPEVKGMAISASPLFDRLIALVRAGNDFDGDGAGTLLGDPDCAPMNPAIGPLARDVPDNGIDENCRNGDASLRDLIAPGGDTAEVPEAFRRDWNILLLTIDTVRYDHTTFGGYQRDTTPRLAELVERSISFSFANAPSAGTMASVPAILTSKFFHSGIALDEKRKKGMPPKLKDENTTLPEIMKRKGYRTGAILSHEYFNDWGMKQGVDDYDNAIGKKPDAERISSHESTDRALAWITKHADKKWFLWVHYLDPHGRYVRHPDGPDWGDSEMDLYDGELHYTDQHVGRLLDELARLPGADRTIVIITSDHGDGFNEHGHVNHGQTLFRELLHVPLIFYIPELPRAARVDGAVSPIDIVPTVADLCGIDVRDLTFEGRSLVPQLFFEGTEDLDRVVFAETNYQGILRAAVRKSHKLVYDVKNDTSKLFDLERDPWEKTNIATRDPAAYADMREALDAWLERVMFARDPEFNQAIGKVTDVLLTEAPAPAHPVTGSAFDGGAIELLGWELDPPDRTVAPGDKLEVLVYFAVKARPSAMFKLQGLAWLTATEGFAPTGPIGPKVARSSSRVTADGFLATDRWRPGEFIRERFKITIPESWKGVPGDAIAFAVKIEGATATGQVTLSDPATVTLGTAPISRPAEKPSTDAGLPDGGGSPAPAP